MSKVTMQILGFPGFISVKSTTCTVQVDDCQLPITISFSLPLMNSCKEKAAHAFLLHK